MLEDTFTYPTKRDDWVKTLLMGGVLIFLGFLLVPLFAVYGYLVRTIRGSIDGDSEPPAFGDWGAMIVEGLKAWVIGVIYMIIPAIVAFVTIGGSLAAIASGSDAGAGLGAAGLFGGLLITGILALVFGYVAVAAIVNFAREERFGAAFDFGQLRTIMFNADYAISWAISVVVFIVAGIVAGIPLIGFILGPFASFYAGVVSARLWAGGYLDAMEGRDGSAAVDSGRPAA